MIDILGAFLAIVAALLPTVLAHIAERKATKKEQNIDALLLKDDPTDASVLLSGLHDQTSGHSAGQSGTDAGV